MVLNFAKGLVKKGASAAVGAVSDSFHRRKIRKKFESYFKETPTHRDPFVFGNAFAGDFVATETLHQFQGIELLEACAGVFLNSHKATTATKFYEPDADVRHKYFRTLSNWQNDYEAAKGSISEIKRGIECLSEISPEAFTKSDDVQTNFKNWIKDMKEEVYSALDQLLDRAAFYEASKLDLKDHLEAFSNKLDDAEVAELIGENQSKVVTLYKTMSDAFGRNELVELQRLAAVPEDVNRINQIETVIDLYTLKMRRVNEDKTLSDDERDVKIASWQSLMEADIQALGGAS